MMTQEEEKSILTKFIEEHPELVQKEYKNILIEERLYEETEQVLLFKMFHLALAGFALELIETEDELNSKYKELLEKIPVESENNPHVEALLSDLTSGYDRSLINDLALALESPVDSKYFKAGIGHDLTPRPVLVNVESEELVAATQENSVVDNLPPKKLPLRSSFMLFLADFKAKLGM